MPESLSRMEENTEERRRKFDTRLRRSGVADDQKIRLKLREQAELPPKRRLEKFEF